MLDVDRPLTRLAQRVLARRAGLPPETTDYRVTSALPVPMRDGVTLLADHYAPLTDTPAGTLLLRGPYIRDSLPTRATVGTYAARGYHVVLQSTRGSFGSGGDFEPGFHEVSDGADTVEWLRGRDWFTGSFSTVGGSYLGFAQWALMVDPPPELDTAVVTMAPDDIGRAAWGTGSFTLSDFLTWGYQMAWHERGGLLRQLVRTARTPRRLAPVFATTPLAAAADSVMGGGAPFYESWLAHSDPCGEYWRGRAVPIGADAVPVLLIGGWQDLFFDQTIRQYETLRDRGADVALVVGPWTHGEGGGVAIRESLQWLGGERRDRPVRVFVTGDGGWRDLPVWPPKNVETVWFPQPDGTLGNDPASGSASFVYDPADPTPTVGGRLLAASSAGYRDDTELAGRADVLAFVGPALEADVEVIGAPRVELVRGADTESADVMVRLSDVDAAGRSQNVSDGYVGFAPDGALTVDLDPVAHRFRVGHRIRLLVGGGSFPRFARNPGTGAPIATATELVASTHTVAFGGFRLVLPVSAD